MNTTEAIPFLCNYILNDGTACGTMEAEADKVTCTECGQVKQESKDVPNFGHSTLK